MPVFTIHHITKYEYDRPVKESSNEIKIYPYLCNDQEILQHEILITSNPDVHVFTDYWGNKIGLFNVLAPHKEMVIDSRLVIRTTQSNQLKINFHSNWQSLENTVKNNLLYLELSDADTIKSQSAINTLIESLDVTNKSIASTVEACSELIYKQFKYIKGITTIETTVDEILEVRAGVCQDFAHLMLQMLRTLKIPSRYVSGYICPNKNGMRGEGATHAWIEAYIPEFGWAGIDPTNNVWATNHHVKLAVGKNFADCSPVKGTFKGPAKQLLSVYVSVGYEDGQVFEEITNVPLQKFEKDTADTFFLEDPLEKQQQQ
ncbi:MAG TPA: transglutaminase family protein [Chitinophagaceae bacterium]|jgi:transglutaminase-like putative cysteine protease|nr:transglutaminase family protein [Chitinophagaceae bacterium]MBP9740813.1 transglutaminase family protein [Chitinophagaceae bacterium]HPH24290.1 transglutaminase family protein [Chitinophagaceae bacterium]